MTGASAPRVASPTLRATALFTAGVFVTILVAACILRVEITASGSARIIPVERVQLIQPEFPGAISAIAVRNGSHVRKGQVLIAFDATAPLVERDLIDGEERRLRIEAARLESLTTALAGAGPEDDRLPATQFSDIAAADDDDARALRAEQKRLLAAERDDIAARLKRASARMAANEKTASIVRGNVSRSEATLAIETERLAAAQKLMETGASSRGAYLQILKSFTELQNGRDVLLRELDEKIALGAVLQAERAGILTTARNEALRRLSEISTRLAALDQQRRAVEQRLEAATLRAPVDGIVEQLAVFTIGGVAQAGQDLLRIVPDGGMLEIEAVFPNRDSGFLAAEQKVRVKLDAFPSERFGTVSARIVDISADAVETEPGRWGFIARLSPETAYLDSPSGRFPLRPGMTASADAITGERTLISYFIAPIIAQFGASLGER